MSQYEGIGIQRFHDKEGISSFLPSSVSAAIVSELSNAMAFVGTDGVKVTISQSATDVLNLQQDMTGLNIGVAALKTETQSEQAVVKIFGRLLYLYCSAFYTKGWKQ